MQLDARRVTPPGFFLHVQKSTAQEGPRATCGM
jgi:hypothetical protein